MSNISRFNFSDNIFYVGIDVHKKSWNVTVHSGHLNLETFSMNPSPVELKKHLERKYPGGKYYSVYEAGFCGFWIHRELCKLGIENRIINPADVPTTDKEKRHKTDSIDSNKLSRELANQCLRAIYIPDEYAESIRGLCRLRERIVSHQTRLKNRIKSFLAKQGTYLAPNSECKHWSARFMKNLKGMQFPKEPDNEIFQFLLEELEQTRQRVLTITRKLRKHTKTETCQLIINLLLTAPGVGFIVAITFYTEIIDIRRFKDTDHLDSFVGLAPGTHSSGEKNITTGITPRQNRYLRYLLIEAAWIAIRKDPALFMCYSTYINRMSSKKAIIRIAKKLVNRMRNIWINASPYIAGTIE
jgi:transposase